MRKVLFLIFAIAAILLTIVNSVEAQSNPGPIPGTLVNSTGNCTSATNVVCTNQVVKFTDHQYWQGNNSDHEGAGAIWKFYNVATDNVSSVQVNATIKVEYVVNATLTNIDNGSTDLFAPTIQPNSVLKNTDKAGYVQFTITFYKNHVTGSSHKWDNDNYSETIELKDLNYVHYDIDGNHDNSYSFRETGVIKQITGTNPNVTANAGTELNPYNYSGDGSTWRGYVGSDEDRAGVSDCSEVVAAFKFTGNYSSVTIRMGYNYKRISGNGLNAQPNAREYGSTFSCFAFPNIISLPVKFHDVKVTLSHQ